MLHRRNRELSRRIGAVLLGLIAVVMFDLLAEYGSWQLYLRTNLFGSGLKRSACAACLLLSGSIGAAESLLGGVVIRWISVSATRLERLAPAILMFLVYAACLLHPVDPALDLATLGGIAAGAFLCLRLRVLGASPKRPAAEGEERTT